MTDTCTCPPAGLIACQTTPSFDYSFAQPTCQILPDDSRVENPIYDSENNITFVSYEVILACGSNLGNLINLYIIICENIPLASVLDVSMLLDSCPDYQSVPFQFNNPPVADSDPPTGFRFLQITVGENIIPGSSAVFRIALSGNYPFEIPPSEPFTAWFALEFTNNSLSVSGGSFIFPACPAVPRLTLTKDCLHIVENNTASLNYRVIVANTGETDLVDVMFTDILNYDGTNVTLGTITVTPDTVSADTTTDGIVEFTGNLGDIPLGGSVEITYNIPIQSFTSPNTYVFSNMATARSGVTEGATECMQNVQVVALETENCCIIDDSRGTFVFTINNQPSSPPTLATLVSSITIPENLILQFTSFGNCTAQFLSGAPVPLNTDLSGTEVFIGCDLSLPSGSSVNSPISFVLISLNAFSATSLVLQSSIIAVGLENPDAQVLFDVSPIPNTETIDIDSILQCQSSL